MLCGVVQHAVSYGILKSLVMFKSPKRDKVYVLDTHRS